MSEITIYYNPFCEISRNALALLRHAGIEPTVIEYMKTPPSRAKLFRTRGRPTPRETHRTDSDHFRA